MNDDAADDNQAGGHQVATMAKLRRRARRRALSDLALTMALATGAALLASDSHGALLVGVSALSLGILFMVIRRSHDAVALARADRWRSEAIAGRGISLADWQNGRELAHWDARRAPMDAGDGGVLNL